MTAFKTLLLMLLVWPAMAQAQFVLLTQNGTITIIGCTSPGLSGAVVIPGATNGLPVTSIGMGAFQNQKNMTSVMIPDSITNIGPGAFSNCFGLTNATIGDGVVTIGAGPFVQCRNLTAITVNPTNSAYSSTNGALFNKNQTTLVQYPCGQGGSFTIPDSVTSIGAEAFDGDLRLTNITLGKSVASIGSAAFQYCTSLAAITVNPTNSAYSSTNGVLFNKTGVTLISYPGGLAGGYSIPGSVTSIGAYAFSASTNLTEVTIPGSVSVIGNNAFAGCASLLNVTIPGSVNALGADVFGGCTSLTNATIGNGVGSIGYQTFEFCYKLTSVTIPGSITSIGDYAFWSCSSLTNLTIPDGVTSLGAEAFSSCTSLATITIPASVTSIGTLPFYICPGLMAINVEAQNPSYSSINGVLFDKSQSTLVEYPGGLGGSYTVPDGVNVIDAFAFTYCDSVTSVTIPGSVTYIGSFAFSPCDSLTAVYFQGDSPEVDATAFNGGSPAVYYLPGTADWGPMFAGLATVPWFLPNPVILARSSSFGVQTNAFGFLISWATNLPVVVEACTDLVNPVWQPIQTNTLTDGASDFSDPQWTNQPARFYRLRSP
ncbi:MAG: leucine-rich repeat domain-containing protein [Verrucomicrobiae bacterium]|nr:leucine-rich repeat domain-containing protein [Verrucomicrobiae bacterium]